MRVLYVEAAYGFGGSLTGLLHLFAALPGEIKPMLVTCFDPRPFVDLPPDLLHRQVTIPKRPQSFGSSRLQTIAQYYRYVIWPWSRALDPLIRDFQPELIHANNSLVSNFGVGLAARRRHVHSISHQKGFEHPGRFTRILVKYSRFDHHLATSGAVARHLQTLGLNRDRCTTVYEPVIGPADGVRATPDQHKVPTVAMHSMLVPEKGQHVFLEAVAKLVERGRQPFRAIVAGTSPDGATEYTDKLARMVDQLGLRQIVEFPGHVRDVYEFLSGVDVSVHAAVDKEPFGRVVAEAMLCGLPSIVTADGGPAEYIEHGATGLCVPRGDVGAMADALDQLIASADLRQQMGAAAREFAVREFEPHALAQQVVNVYYRVLRRSAEGAAEPAGKLPH
jgi:glycosyltransferase involved in cell wall biosynthesis